MVDLILILTGNHLRAIAHNSRRAHPDDVIIKVVSHISNMLDILSILMYYTLHQNAQYLEHF